MVQTLISVILAWGKKDFLVVYKYKVYRLFSLGHQLALGLTQSVPMGTLGFSHEKMSCRTLEAILSNLNPKRTLQFGTLDLILVLYNGK